MQIHYLRIPRRQFGTARRIGERRRAAALLGLPPVPETLGEFLNDRRPEYESYVAVTAQTTHPAERHPLSPKTAASGMH